MHTPDLLPEAINELFCRNEHNYNKFIIIIQDRERTCIQSIKTKLYCEKTIAFQGTTFWNNLPDHIKKCRRPGIIYPRNYIVHVVTQPD